MTQEERTKICYRCKHRSFSLKQGLLCEKTGQKPDFQYNCTEYIYDEESVDKPVPSEVAGSGKKWMWAALIVLANMILIPLVIYFVNIDFSCWVNEKVKSVNECTRWYADEIYEAASEGDTDDFLKLMTNFHEWVDHFGPAGYDSFSTAFRIWNVDNPKKAEVIEIYTDKVGYNNDYYLW